MDTTTSCTSCIFFDNHASNGKAPAADAGLCRFNPPISQPGPDAHGLWPVVTTNDWCGHFTAQRQTSRAA